MVDTNLIVSGTATASTTPYHLLEAWRNGEYVLLTSPSIIEEVAKVLRRPEKNFSITNQEIEAVIDVLKTRAFVTTGILTVDIVKDDPDDNKFIACAIEGSATHIVSGDKDLLRIGEYQGIKIVKARNFLEVCLNKKI
ncbi:putative toxin-antitoxin system toxin component, PIN family [Candidatus Gottesmanbacteria bacterium]|nr:putative toxin-antitoxin system toxin component, PIN family [Candidatus Gottesmanbacteria bacterium]